MIQRPQAVEHLTNFIIKSTKVTSHLRPIRRLRIEALGNSRILSEQATESPLGILRAVLRRLAMEIQPPFGGPHMLVFNR